MAIALRNARVLQSLRDQTQQVTVARFEAERRLRTLQRYADFFESGADGIVVIDPEGTILFSNPRGGSGYSEAWGRAIRGPIDGSGPGWGTVDYEDVMGVVDTALDRFDFIDPERLGVLGGSYGGYLTSWIVGHTNRFKAALSERAVNQLVSAFGSSDLFWVFERQFGGSMYDHVDEWLCMSPTTYAKQIETPLLILHSEDDLRCNVEQGEHLFTLLRLQGKEVELLRFPAESHELSRSGSPLHRVQRFEAILEWFGRHLAS